MIPLLIVVGVGISAAWSYVGITREWKIWKVLVGQYAVTATVAYFAGVFSR